MTFHYESVAVYSELGGALRLAKGVRALVSDPTTGAPVDATQGARVAPYVDADATGNVTFTAESWPVRLTVGATFEDLWPIDAAGPVDATVAGLVGAATATQTALDGRYVQGAATQPVNRGGTGATDAAGARTNLGLGSVDNTTDLDKPVSTATAAAIATLQAQTPTIEELIVAVLCPDFTVSSSAPILVAPFPLKIISASLVTWQSATPASDTNYWEFLVRKQTPTALTVIAAKNTKVTGGVEILLRIDWNFDTVSWDTTEATFAKGDALSLAGLKTGTPAAVLQPLLTVRYQPL